MYKFISKKERNIQIRNSRRTVQKGAISILPMNKESRKRFNNESSYDENRKRC